MTDKQMKNFDIESPRIKERLVACNELRKICVI